MRRKQGELLPLERDILAAAESLRARGIPEFYGALISKEIKDVNQARLLTAFGTIYKALERMEGLGLIESRWEDIKIAKASNRPQHRLYRVIAGGER